MRSSRSRSARASPAIIDSAARSWSTSNPEQDDLVALTNPAPVVLVMLAVHTVARLRRGRRLHEARRELLRCLRYGVLHRLLDVLALLRRLDRVCGGIGRE